MPNVNLHNLEELPEEPWGEWPDECPGENDEIDDEADFEQVAQDADDAMRDRVERLVDPIYIEGEV